MQRANGTNFLAFLNLTDGAIRTLELPFAPVLFVVGNSRSGKQSLIVLADYPRINIFDNENVSPVNRKLDLRRYFRVAYTVEETVAGELKGTLSDEIPKFDSLMHNEIPALVIRVVLDHDGELLYNDELIPDTLYFSAIRWNSQNWWFFDLRANFRVTSHWLNDRGEFNVAGAPVTIAVLSGWGHWCQWHPCQDAILQLGPNGEYKLIDITTQDINALLLTSRSTLLATRTGTIHEYDLQSVQENMFGEPRSYQKGTGLDFAKIRSVYKTSKGSVCESKSARSETARKALP